MDACAGAIMARTKNVKITPQDLICVPPFFFNERVSNVNFLFELEYLDCRNSMHRSFIEQICQSEKDLESNSPTGRLVEAIYPLDELVGAHSVSSIEARACSQVVRLFWLNHADMINTFQQKTRCFASNWTVADHRDNF